LNHNEENIAAKFERKMNMELKFVGEYKVLKSVGYRYLKLYADNLICYRKADVLIWKKGNDIEIDSFYSNSGVLFKYLVENHFKLNNEFNKVVINKETKQVEAYDMKKHEVLFQIGKSEDEMNHFYRKYIIERLNDETIQCLKELYEKQLISFGS